MGKSISNFVGDAVQILGFLKGNKPQSGEDHKLMKTVYMAPYLVIPAAVITYGVYKGYHVIKEKYHNRKTRNAETDGDINQQDKP